MKYISVLIIIIAAIINFEENYIHGATLKSTRLSYLGNVFQRTVRQTNALECTIPTISNAIINITNQIISSRKNILILNITCDDNFVLRPAKDSILTCINGFWTVDEYPECKRCKMLVDAFDVDADTDSEIICAASLYENSIYKNCGQRIDKIHQPFIVNGTFSKFAEFPWHVAIYKKDQNDSEPIYICGGSIINDKNILTAAHCLSNAHNGKIITSSEYYAAAGKYHSKYISDSETSQRRKIIKINLHPRYEGILTNFAWDIAVVTVHEPFQISKLVHAVCIDWKTQFENEHLSAQKYGEIAGWGIAETNLNAAASELRVLKVPFIEEEQCTQHVPETFLTYITSDKFCAGYMNGSSVCNGDSGGGLVFERQEKGQTKYYIRGLVSIGVQDDGRCDDYKYSTYTKVSDYISFIQDCIQNKNNSTGTTFESPTTIPGPEMLLNATEPSVSCKTPNNETAKCISIYDCKLFVKALEKYPTTGVTNYIKDSDCGKEGEKKVCCGSTINYLSVILSNPVTSNPIQHRNLNLLPAPGVCGRQTLVRKGRITGGSDADLYDYPWMALLEYGPPEKSTVFNYFDDSCAGFLINERYVITSAWCTRYFSPRRVRLGEYNYETEIDCVNSNCADPLITVEIEEVVQHPLYNFVKHINDIALIRLARNVSYTNFIRPVCLPVNGETSSPGRRMFMAGWALMKSYYDSPIKQKVSVYAASQEECINEYKHIRNITSSHFCIRGDEEKAACYGDWGGPVMATLSNSKDIYAEGIVSITPICGREEPSVATRIASFMNWILDVIRP